MNPARLATCLLTALAFASPCLAQEPRDDGEWPAVPPAEDEAPPGTIEDDSGDWMIRLSWDLGGAYFYYSESLERIDAKSKYDSGSFAIRSLFEANLSGFSPHVRLLSHFTGGTEEFVSDTTRQEDDLAIQTVLLDVGCGFRVELGSTIVLVPSIAYTFDYLGFERDNFEINGQRVLIQDFDGDALSSVEETIIGHGISLGLAVEAQLTSSVSFYAHFIGTSFPDAEVDNEIGGEISTEGYMVRSGFAVVAHFLRKRVNFRGSFEVGVHEYKKSTEKTRSGSAVTATVQFPDSETVWVLFGVGVEVRF